MAEREEKMKFLKVKSVVLALLLVPALLAGCGDEDKEEKDDRTSRYEQDKEDEDSKTSRNEQDDEDGSEAGATDSYPVIEAVDYSGMELETISNSEMSYSYPAGEWEQIFDDPLQIAWEETINTNQAVNINMNVEATGVTQDDWMDDLMEELSNENLESAGYGITVEASEVRSLNGEPVVYMELITQITDEMLDLMIDSGIYTEEMIDSIGGRETLLAAPPTTQIAIYTVKDGTILSCTGTYYAPEQKQNVLDTMSIMIQTAEEN